MAVITISRQFGSGGVDIGKKLAKRIGYTYVDKELIEEVAKRAKVSTDDVMAFEKSGSTIMMDIIHTLLNKEYIKRYIPEQHGYLDDKTYISLIKDIIKNLYKIGNVVIIGRGSQYILKGYENAWHILIVGDIATRVGNIMNRFELTEEEAKKEVKQADTNRSRFLSSLLDKKSHEDVASYDLVINMNRISSKKAENMITTLIAEL